MRRPPPAGRSPECTHSRAPAPNERDGDILKHALGSEHPSDSHAASRPSRAVWRYVLTAARLLLLAASLWALSHEFSGQRPIAVYHRLIGYGFAHIALGVACTALSFLLLGAVELLALRTAGGPAASIPRREAFGTAFVAHALSQSVGFAVLTGATVRLRAYQRRGLGGTQVAQVSAAVTLTLTLGLLSAAAWAFVGASAPVVAFGRTIPVRPVGSVLAGAVIAYLGWSLIGRGPRAPRKRWRIARPTVPVAVTQIALSTADWFVTGVVLYAFTAGAFGLGLWLFMPAYVVAQTVGVVSHVPAGAGVFELALLGLLTAANPACDRAALLAALIMYRVVYYVVPLCVALAVAGLSELRRARAPSAEITASVRPIPR